MAEYMRVFAVLNIAEIHKGFAGAAREAALLNASDRRHNRPQRALHTERELARLYDKFVRDIDRAARRGAETATRAIVRKLDETAIRAETDKRRHLSSFIKSRPANLGLLGTGAVGVADIAELNKAIDPDYPGKGPYWAAQEYGTDKHVGRKIYGFFHGNHPAERPNAQLSGGGEVHGKGALHTAFSPSAKFTPVAGAGSRGGKGGKGTIRVALKPRHFIRDGADQARDVWRASVFAVSADVISDLQRTVSPRRGRR